jgi:cytochrome c oxidase subunit IV
MSKTAAQGHSPHVSSRGALVSTALALLALTVVTVAVSRVDLGNLNVAVALAVASVKVSLVALVFMHLKYEDRFQTVILVSSIFFVALLVAFVLFDSSQYQPDILQRLADEEAQGR